MASRKGGNGESEQDSQTQNNDLDIPGLIRQQREKLVQRRQEVEGQRVELQKEIDSIDNELRRIDLYLNPDAALQQTEEKKPRQPRQPKDPNAPPTQRAPRGERRQQVLELIQANPDGLTRGEILERLGAKGEKAAEQSISNALHNMLKQEPQPIARKGDGRYVPA